MVSNVCSSSPVDTSLIITQQLPCVNESSHLKYHRISILSHGAASHSHYGCIRTFESKGAVFDMNRITHGGGGFSVVE